MKLKCLHLCLFVALVLALSCSGGGGGGSGPKASWRTSSFITAQEFVDSLNEVDNLEWEFFQNYLEKDVWDTQRTWDDNGHWFVIWDETAFQHRSVNRDYLRAIEYYAYYTDNYKTAETYRYDEYWDLHWTDESEEVQEIGTDMYGLPLFVGVNTGYLYEDDTETYDVSLAQKEERDDKDLMMISKISSLYKIDANAAAAVFTLGVQVKNMLNKGNGSLTPEDQNAIVGTLENYFDMNLEDVTTIFLAGSQEEQDKLFDDMAKKMGTNSGNLRQNVLGKLFGVEI